VSSRPARLGAHPIGRSGGGALHRDRRGEQRRSLARRTPRI